MMRMHLAEAPTEVKTSMEQQEIEKRVEHPRTYTRHMVDEIKTKELLTGTATVCGLILSTSPGAILGDGEDCLLCEQRN